MGDEKASQAGFCRAATRWTQLRITPLARRIRKTRPWPFIKAVLIIIIALSLVEIVSADFAYVMAADIIFYIECLLSIFVAGAILRRYPTQGVKFLNVWTKIVVGDDSPEKKLKRSKNRF